ncbi:laccase-4-like isoform X2 [Pseudomyrmex gracilis]|uniref:laccase-4-like isoform X2 n=1 Tax=Pseudomyrmex gracilis TaxID=219809 RepID=UPI000995AB08|nr:laccase-4-like isoform X2 [Pseudomyrmex gracilis]
MSCLCYLQVLMLVSCSILVLCSQTFDNDYHECARPCFDKTSSKKTCVYHFFVRESYSLSFCNKFKNETSTCANIITGRNRLIINGKSPGPAIEICLGDTLEVLVYNKLGSDELAFHWHGIRQKGSNHMDGVPMITQCPILPFTGFRYTINPDSTGTYFYHAHSVSQQGDGIYGSLTVRGPQDNPTLERILVLSSRPSTPLTRQSYLYPPTPSELLVNGQEREAVVQVKHGFPYLLRLINAIAHDCPILLSVHGHSLHVLAADGNPVQSMRGTHVVLFPGERLDSILMTDKAVGKYALDIQGLRDCRDLRHEAHILYEDADVDSHTIKATDKFHDQMFNVIESGHDCHRASKNVICSLDLKSKEFSQLEEKADETIYVSVDSNAFSIFTDEMTDKSYNIYVSKYYPAYLSLDKDVKKIPQINGMSFKYPSSPILAQPEDAFRELICSLDKRSSQCADTPLFCECLQIVQVPLQKIIEVVLINEETAFFRFWRQCVLYVSFAWLQR